MERSAMRGRPFPDFAALNPGYDGHIYKEGARFMRILSMDTEQIKLRDLIDAARNEPVTILENGEPAAVVLSPAEFNRLDEHDRVRREVKTRLRQTIDSIHGEASERGLTETELERLLADES